MKSDVRLAQRIQGPAPLIPRKTEGIFLSIGPFFHRLFQKSQFLHADVPCFLPFLALGVVGFVLAILQRKLYHMANDNLDLLQRVGFGRCSRMDTCGHDICYLLVLVMLIFSSPPEKKPLLTSQKSGPS